MYIHIYCLCSFIYLYTYICIYGKRFNALHGKLHQRLGDMSSEKNEYPFYWQDDLYC